MHNGGDWGAEGIDLLWLSKIDAALLGAVGRGVGMIQAWKPAFNV